MKMGVVACGTVNLNERKLKDETCLEFITFMEDLNIEHQKEYDKRELFKKFVDLDDDGKIRNKDLNWMKMRSFTKFLQLWAEYRDEMAGYKTRRSNGIDWVMFMHDKPVYPENLVGAVLLPEKSKHCTPVEGERAAPDTDELPY